MEIFMKKFVAILMLLIIFQTVFCENYKLEDLIRIGLENSYDMQSQKIYLQNAKSDLRSSYLDLLPGFSASFGSSRNFDQTNEWENNASLSLNKSFFLNEPSYYNVRFSILDMKNAEISDLDQKKQVVYSIFSDFLSILEAQKNLEIQKSNLKLQQHIHKQIQIQFENGEKSKLDLKQSENSLIDYQIAVKDAEISLSKTRSELFLFLDHEDRGYIFQEPNISEWQIPKFRLNLSLEQRKNEIKKSEINLFQQKMNFLPSLSLSYSLYHNDPDDVYAFGDYQRSSNTLALNASYDIFDLLDKKENLGKTRRNLKLQKLAYELAKNELEKNWQILEKELKNLENTRDLYQQKLKLAEENLQMAQQQYNLGVISLLELDRIKLDYQNSQISYLNRYYQLLRKQEEMRLLISDKILGKW